MSERPQGTILNRTSRIRFTASIRDFAASADGWKAKLLVVALFGLLLAINSLNVVSSYIGRDFMTAVASRDWREFTVQTVYYVGIFLVCAFTATVYRFVEERLALLWREFLTRRVLGLYLRRRFYHHLGDTARIGNPDQRISEDVKLFTQTSLAFVLMISNATLTVLAFSGVMISISPLLFGVAIAYAAIGSTMTIWLGRPLIWINYNQFDREAEFRADLVQLREHSEFVALAHHEPHFESRLKQRIDRIVENYRKLIAVNRNLNFFTSTYNYYIQIIPVLVVAPLFIRQEVEFGVITQASVAFAQLLGGFSLIVTQFQSISSYTAVVARLDDFSDVSHASDDAPAPPIEVVDGDDGLVYEHLTLESPDDGHVLVEDLSIEIRRGTHVLVTGAGEIANAAKMALFRATADLWSHGRGRIVRPQAKDISFVTERPYLPPGTLRETLFEGGGGPAPTDERLDEILAMVDLKETVVRLGGLDVERDWDDVLSLGELQRFVLARLLLIAPAFAVLDRLETTLDPECLGRVLRTLAEEGTTYMTIARGEPGDAHYDFVLDLSGTGPWTLAPYTQAVPA